MKYKLILVALLALGTAGCSNTLPRCDGSNLSPINQVPLSVTCHHPSCKTAINYH